MNKISETLISAGGNLARPTRFTALIAPPPELTTQAKIFDVLCKDIQIPDITMEPIELTFKGHTVKIPGRVNQDQTIEVTIYLDEYHNLRQFFSNWIGAMDNRYYAVNSQETENLSKSDNLYGNLIIKARDFNETNSDVMNYLFEGVYPISVGGPNFGASNIGEVTEITITFAYFRFITGLSSTNAKIGSENGKEFEDHDEFLSVFGPSAKGTNTSGIENILNFDTGLNKFSGSLESLNNLRSAFNRLKGI